MTTFFVILGNSGAGKDSVARSLNQLCVNFVEVVKFARAYKSLLEMQYDLPFRALDTDEYKNQLVPGESYTFLDELVRAYHMQTAMFTSEKLDSTMRCAVEAVENGYDVAFTDVRMVEELVEVIELADVLGACIVVFKVERDASTALSTDSNLPELVKILTERCDLKVTTIYNNGTLQDLHNRVAELVM